MYSYFKTGRDVRAHTPVSVPSRYSEAIATKATVGIPSVCHVDCTKWVPRKSAQSPAWWFFLLLLLILTKAKELKEESLHPWTDIICWWFLNIYNRWRFLNIWFVLGHACMNGYNLCGRSQERIKNMEGLRAFWWNKITACCLLGGLQAFQGCNEHVALACLSSLIDYVTRLWGYIYLSIFFIFRLISAWNLCALTPVGS
jgi:hypothetical protein